MVLPITECSRGFFARADQVITVGRAVLASAALLAVWLVAEEYRLAACVLLAIYTLYALALAAAVWRREALDEHSMLAVHVIDLAVFTVLISLTDGTSSPLFSFLIFALIAATLCWQWQGVLWTAAACLVILLGHVGVDVLVGGAESEDFELAVNRTAYLVVATLLLASLGLHQTQVRAQLWRLATQPAETPESEGWPVRESLDYAAHVFGTSRILLVWGEAEEPWIRLSLWVAGTIQEERVSPDRFEPWLAEPLREVGFLVPDAVTGDAVVHCGSGRFEWRRGVSLHPDLVADYGIQTALVVPAKSEFMQAHLLLLDVPEFVRDDLLIAEAAAGRIGAMFEQARLTRELREAAAAAERTRLARDLHDGVLQFLAGTALQLSSLLPLVREDPEQAGRHLAEIQDALAYEQRELRTLVRALGPLRSRLAPAGGVQPRLAERLRGLAARLERQWDVAVRWRLSPEDARVPEATAHDLAQIVGEAAANAARHGGAKQMTVAIKAATGMLAVAIEDDGHGFAFTGRLDEVALAARNLGPRSMRERIVARGGGLVVATRSGRTRLEIVLPHTRERQA